MVTTLKRGASKKSIKNILDRLAKQFKLKGVDAHKYVGTIKLKKDALSLQRTLRDEWA